MDPTHRIVTQTPLTELWNESGPVAATRGKDLGPTEVAERFRRGCVAVLASPGEPLYWRSGDELFAWWKSEGKRHSLDPSADGWVLDDLPGERGWLASEWLRPDGSVVIAFEEFH